MYSHMNITYISHMLTSCDGLIVNGCHRSKYLNAWSLLGGTTLETISCDLVGGGVSLGVGLEASKTYARPSLFLPSTLGSGCESSQLLLQHHVYLLLSCSPS